MIKFKSKFHKALFFLISIIAIGVVGYMILSGFNFVDAVYMTVITISTVGFRELHPMGNDEKIFTIFLILTSISLFGYAVSAFTEALASGVFFKQLKLKRVQQRIDKLKNHTIVCGYGRNGMQAIIKLKNYQKEFVVIEKNKDLIATLDEEGVLYVEGDATTDEVLMKAGIEKVSNLITALPSDADNLFVVLSARQINENLCIISRASQETTYSKLKLAGANNVILPDMIGGDHMASLVVIPGLMEFIDNLSIVGKSNINIEEVAVEKLFKNNGKRTIRDLDLRKKTGCTVLGSKDENGEYPVNPEPDLKLAPSSKIIVLGKPEQIEDLNSEYDIE